MWQLKVNVTVGFLVLHNECCFFKKNSEVNSVLCLVVMISVLLDT